MIFTVWHLLVMWLGGFVTGAVCFYDIGRQKADRKYNERLEEIMRWKYKLKKPVKEKEE